MNREEAKKLVTDYSENMTIEDFEADTIIDIIYDDIESKQCIKCKHWRNDMYCTSIDTRTKHDFRCSFFEKKQ